MRTMPMQGVMVSALTMGLAVGVVAQEKTAWTDNVKLSGDARVRYQSMDEEGKDAREEWRLRARLVLDAKVNEQVKANLRLVTNAGNPISDNITMSGSFEDKTARFDRVVLIYTPVEALSLRFGKMAQPWIVVDDLVFAADANPEGAAANAKLALEGLSLNLHGGAFVVQERAADDDTKLYSGQAAIRLDIDKNNYVMAGASIYAFDAVKGYPVMNKFDGNSKVKNAQEVDVYAGEYTIVEGFVQAGLSIGIPVTLGAQYAVNTDAFSSDDTAYLGMASAKLPYNLGVGYQYRYLEKDATFAAFAENTDFGWGTDIKGHIPYVSYQVNKNVDLKVQYAMGQKGLDNGKDINTFKVDLACKF